MLKQIRYFNREKYKLFDDKSENPSLSLEGSKPWRQRVSKTMSTDIRQREKSEDGSDTWEGVLKVINAISSFNL